MLLKKFSQKLSKKLTRLPVLIGMDRRIRQSAICHANLVVCAGPFEGLKFDQDFFTENPYFSQFILRVYEKELHKYLDAIIQKPINTIVVIGAAEGYYPVGLALRKPETAVIAYEMCEHLQEKCQSLAHLNGVNNQVIVKGKCEPANLKKTLHETGNTFIICDVEGYECDLLTPETIPTLKETTILVELHEKMLPGIGHLLRNRFSPSHQNKEIKQVNRTIADYPYRSLWSKLFPQLFVNILLKERRGSRQSWLLLTK